MMKSSKSFEAKIKELEIQNESLDREIEDFYLQMNVTPEQLTALLENQQHFSEKNWAQLQALRMEIDQQLQDKLDQIQHPKKTFQEQINPNWLFVK